MKVLALFEAELRRRGIAFTIDSETGQHALQVGDSHLLVSLENLERDFARDVDEGRVTRFVDAIVATAAISEETFSADRLYWALEPNNYVESADFRVALSDQVDRVLVHLSSDGDLITWITPEMLSTLELSESEATEIAFSNLAQALSQATLEVDDINGMPLGYLSTTLPFKASLILAPNLKQVARKKLGWPLLAVVPDRDFLYLWAARHSDFVEHVGSVVVREYSEAAYPISTEVYEITDKAIRAIGAFPTDD